MACPACNDSRRVWLDDEDHPKGGLLVPCHRCSCDECGALLDAPYGVCLRGCDAPDLDVGTAREVGER